MIGYLTLILSCQLIGEIAAGLTGIPVPGPVLGMGLLFAILLLRGEIPEGLGQTADTLLRSMSLLFVPAGTGIMMHFSLLGEAMLPLGVSLAISTLLTILVTGLMMRWLGKADSDG